MELYCGPGLYYVEKTWKLSDNRTIPNNIKEHNIMDENESSPLEKFLAKLQGGISIIMGFDTFSHLFYLLGCDLI